MNNKIVKINNTDLSVKEFKGQRVVTFKDIDMLHERVEGTAKRNFTDNKKHFIENVDYFELSKNDVGTDFVLTYGFDKKAPKGMLITESGYLMLVKSLQDDLAWKVQRELVNNYFRVKENVQALNTSKLSKELQAILMLDEKTLELKRGLEETNNKLDNFVEDLPLIGDESDELVAVVRSKGTEVLGGKDSLAYKDKSLSKKIYSNIWKYVKEQFNVKKYKAIKRRYLDKAKEIVKAYEPPFYLKEEIIKVNNQLDFKEVI